MNFTIAPMQDSHWDVVRTIYEEGIATGNATFETSAPTWEIWNTGHLQRCRFVAEHENEVLGWAALSPVSSRCVYGGVAEVSVYVAAKASGQGLGRTLLQALIKSSESEGIWTLQAGIFPENHASIAIHIQCGFREVGRRERLGKMNGIWRDVLLFERRSRLVE
jgi:phosphinothricin acetyltransferase